MDSYSSIFSGFVNTVKGANKATEIKRNKRPLKMPKNYDFSVRNVNWKDYEKDYILRTDAVWEKSKLKDVFYALYKTMVYDKINNRYLVADIRQNPFPTNEAEHIEDWVPFIGYHDIDGLIWQVSTGPVVHEPTSFSQFIGDKEGDAWYLCFVAFQNFMTCNERSPVKLDELNLYNQALFEYECYNEFEKITEYCGPDMFEPMFEIYKLRSMSGMQKPRNYSRLLTMSDMYNAVSDSKVQHY